jgi:hypothetical protein
MDLVAAYTEDRDQATTPRIYTVSPQACVPGTSMLLRGAGLLGSGRKRRNNAGLVAIDHVPLPLDLSTWSNGEVRFVLPSPVPGVHAANGDPVRVWISAIVDGIETNGVPLTIVTSEHTHTAANSGGNGHAQPVGATGL